MNEYSKYLEEQAAYHDLGVIKTFRAISKFFNDTIFCTPEQVIQTTETKSGSKPATPQPEVGQTEIQ
jgi:hypothetical protein